MTHTMDLVVVVEGDGAALAAAVERAGLAQPAVALAVRGRSVQRSIDGATALSVLEIGVGFVAGVATEVVASLIYDLIKEHRAKRVSLDQRSVDATLAAIEQAVAALRATRPEE